MQTRAVTCALILSGLLGSGMTGCEIQSGDSAEWACKITTSGQDVHHFMNGLGVYTEPHAVMSIAASPAGLYVFYRKDLEGTADWGWKQATSLDDADNYLNKTGPYSGDPVGEVMVGCRSSGDLYLYYRGSAVAGSWGWRQAATVDDLHGFVNGIDSQEVARDGAFCGLSQSEVIVYYRVDVTGSGDWRWKISDSVDDVCSFLNGDGDYGDPVEDARVLATSDGEFYVFYTR